MHEIDNEDRRGWARAALDAFGAQTGQTGYAYDDPDCLSEIAGDLICNLLHLADAAGLDGTALIERGLDHWANERENDEDDELPDSDGRNPAVTYDHDARPDDSPGPGDRCKECGDDITWVGPSPLIDWVHVAEQEAGS